MTDEWKEGLGVALVGLAMAGASALWRFGGVAVFGVCWLVYRVRSSGRFTAVGRIRRLDLGLRWWQRGES